MGNLDDLLGEFDDLESDEEGVEEPELSTLPAAIADPSSQEASILNPDTGLTEKAPLDSRVTRWRFIPMPVREKAFFLWVEYGDYPSVAAKLGMKVAQVRALAERDKWEDRAVELRAGLEQGLATLILEKQRESTRMALAILGELDPKRAANMLEGKDIVRLLLGMGQTAARNGQSAPLSVDTGGGPAQINLNPDPSGSSPFANLSDEELAKRARERGVDVQAAPRALDRPPLSLPEDAGGQLVGDEPSSSEDGHSHGREGQD